MVCSSFLLPYGKLTSPLPVISINHLQEEIRMHVTCFHTFVLVDFQPVHACWTEVSWLVYAGAETHTHMPSRALPARVKSNWPVMFLQLFLCSPFKAHWSRDHTFIHRRRGGSPRHAVLTQWCMLARLQPPKTRPYFTRSLSHPSYPQSPLPGTSVCTRRQRRRRWQRGWPLAGWGKFLDKVPKRPPGSQCYEPTPTLRVWGLLSLKLRVKLM